MKLYMHPVSTTSRPIRLFIAENKLDVTEQVVDLMVGEHYQPAYATMNPNRLVPMLEDGDFRLTESAAILKYLASKFDLPSYPKDLQKRARVDEMMDWFNTQFCRDFAYGLTYPQIFPNHKRASAELQTGTVAWAKERAQYWLSVLDTHWIGPDKQYLCGNEITVADYHGAGFVSVGEVIRCDFSKHPNVNRWLGNMKKLESWNRINEALYGFANAVKDQPFEAL
jgi:glutathione S-transferase